MSEEIKDEIDKIFDEIDKSFFAMQKEDLEFVLKANPKLGYFGWECQGIPFVSWNSVMETAVHEFIQCKTLYFQICSRMKTLTFKQSSYALKHEAERNWPYSEDGKHGGYVSNGSAIAAAISLGKRCKRESLTSPNSIILFRINREQLLRNIHASGKFRK